MGGSGGLGALLRTLDPAVGKRAISVHRTQPYQQPPPPTRQQLDDYPPQPRHNYDEGYSKKEHHERTKEVMIDPNSSLIRGRQLQFDSDGRVDPNCPAVRDGDVLINKDGTIDKRSKALKKPALQFKKH